MKKKNLITLSMKLALEFVDDHRELFEEWVKKKYGDKLAKE